MKNKYLTKQQQNDIVISILYDWSLRDRDYPSISTVSSRISVEFISKFDNVNLYKLLTKIRKILFNITVEYALVNYINVKPKLIQQYAKEKGFHIIPMKVI